MNFKKNLPYLSKQGWVTCGLSSAVSRDDSYYVEMKDLVVLSISYKLIRRNTVKAKWI